MKKFFVATGIMISLLSLEVQAWRGDNLIGPRGARIHGPGRPLTARDFDYSGQSQTKFRATLSILQYRFTGDGLTAEEAVADAVRSCKNNAPSRFDRYCDDGRVHITRY